MHSYDVRGGAQQGALCFLSSLSSSSLIRPLLRHPLRTLATRRFTHLSTVSNTKCLTTPSFSSPSQKTPITTPQNHQQSTKSTPSSPSQGLRPLRKNDAIDVTITRIGYGGASVGRITFAAPFIQPEDFDLIVYAPKGACPGDVIRCSVLRIRRRGGRPNNLPIKPPPDVFSENTPTRSYVEVLFSEMLKPSPEAQPVPCKHFGQFHLGGGGCGGCSSMQMAYDMQLREKEEQVRILFSTFIERDGCSVQKMIPCDNTLNYRNKMEFSYAQRWHMKNPNPRKLSVSSSTTSPSSIGSPLEITPDTATKKEDDVVVDDNVDSKYALGLFVPKRYDKVIEINECHIQHAVGNDILQFIREMAEKMLLEPFDPKANSGYLRNVSIRTATSASGQFQIMVDLITSPCEVPQRLQPLAKALTSEFSNIVCVVQNMRGATGGGIHDTIEKSERLLFGKRAYIEQSLCGLTFRISANSFFQTNPEQAVKLFREVKDAAQLSKNDVLLDLFCGTGTIGLSLARHSKHVYGIDSTESAIADAQVNAVNNGVRNASFLQTNLEKLKEMRRKDSFSLPFADVIVVDPPRAGLHPELIKYLASSEAKRIVYVSCNPVTQVRDIRELMDRSPGMFRVSRIQPVDMFPNTHHVECVTTIERLPHQ